MKRLHFFQTLLLAVLVVIGFGEVTYADSFRLRIEDVTAGVGAVITDQGPGDGSPTVGVITFNNLVGSFNINVTTGISKPVIGGVTNLAELDLNSVDVHSTGGAATLKITLEDTDYLLGANGSLLFNGLVGGTLTAPAGSTVTFQTWVNPNNSVIALGADQAVGAIGAIGAIPAGSVPAFTPPGVSFGPGAFSSTGNTTFTKTGPYSIFSQATIAINGTDSISFNLDAQVIPEPSALLLMGAGFVSLVALIKNRRNFAR